MNTYLAVDKRVAELYGFLHERRPLILTTAEIMGELPALADDVNEKLLDATIQKTILVNLKKKLDADPSLAQRFLPATGWQLLNQLLTAARLRELSQVKIVKRGGKGGLRYDISELSATYYGKQILTGLKLKTIRKVVDKDELAAIVDALGKAKLRLPEAVEPTTTEKFFGEKA